MQREFVDEMLLYGRGHYYIRKDERVLTFSPSSGGKFFYLAVYNGGDPDKIGVKSNWDEERQRLLNRQSNGDLVWPSTSEKALGYWAASTQGFSTLICQTPDGERHISIEGPSK